MFGLNRLAYFSCFECDYFNRLVGNINFFNGFGLFRFESNVVNITKHKETKQTHMCDGWNIQIVQGTRYNVP